MNYCTNNILKSPYDSRDHEVSFPVTSIYSHVDLLPDVFEVEDQGYTGSCGASAAASAMEIAYKRAGNPKDFSRLFIYWYARQLGGIVGDNGAYARDICKALQQYGVCLESTWDFLPENIDVEPPEIAITEAKQYPVYEYARIMQGDIVRHIKQSVSEGIPVLTSIKISNQFESLQGDWKLHDWDPSTEGMGDHAVVIIGYDDEAERFLAQNSWGPGWGDGGFFGIPYYRIGTDSYRDYYRSNKSAYEYWVLSRIDVPYIKYEPQEVTNEQH
jgi:C1A family cysteine protease